MVDYKRSSGRKGYSYGLHDGRYPKGGHYDHQNARQYMWIAGEVGDRITAIRDSELYMNSAHTIENLLVTRLGNLEMLPKYNETVIPIGTPVTAIDTQFSFYVLASTDGIRTIRKSDRAVLKHYAISIPERCNVTVIDTFVFICDGNTTILELNTADGDVALSNFKDSIQLPLKWREFITVDVLHVRTIDSELVPYVVAVQDDVELVKDGSGNLKIKDTAYTIKRIYEPYQADLITDPPEGMKDGDVYLVIRPFTKSSGASFVLDNLPFNLTGKVESDKGTYYTGNDLPNGSSGTLDYGIIYDLTDDMIDVTEYQNRLWIAHGEEVFVSEIADYNNFRNDVLSDSAFYFKTSTIRDERPTILRLLAGNGMFILTDKGVFSTGYGETVSPDSINLTIASDEPATREAVAMDDELWYLSDIGELMVIQNISDFQGSYKFKPYYAEKYALNKDYLSLECGRIKGVRYVVVNRTNKDGAYLYKSIDENSFARTSITLSGGLIPYQDDFFAEDKFYDATTMNCKDAKLKINPPHLESVKGGALLNDRTTNFHRFVTRLLDENNSAVLKVAINGNILNRLGSTNAGMNSLYVYDGGETIEDGVTIDITSTETGDILEVQAVEVFYKVNGD